MTTVADLELLLRPGEKFLPAQLEALTAWQGLQGPSQRLCLYQRTGAGKSLTALACLALDGHRTVLVVSPPSTHRDWRERGRELGLTVVAVSHAKFRQPGFQLSKSVPVIADEFHLFGGARGLGWLKLDRLAQHLQAPLIMCSATPNYNDAERCYCVQRILDPGSVKGGFIAFIYAHCTTKQNQFGMMPLVTGFHKYPDAEAYLIDLPNVVFLKQENNVDIVDLPVPSTIPDEFETFSYSRRTHRIMASEIEQRHQRVYSNLIHPNGYLRDHIYDRLLELSGEATTPVLLNCNSSKVAMAVARSCLSHQVPMGLVTGRTSAKEKDETLDEFREGHLDVLIGTASLATGTDGLDKVCDTMVIVNDTDDDSLRKQLIGRILPRGAATDVSNKHVYRLVCS